MIDIRPGADDGPRQVLDSHRQIDGRRMGVGQPGKDTNRVDKLAVLLVKLPQQIVFGHQVRLLALSRPSLQIVFQMRRLNVQQFVVPFVVHQPIEQRHVAELVAGLQAQQKCLVGQSLDFHGTSRLFDKRLDHEAGRFGDAGRLRMTGGRRVELLQDETHLLVAILTGQQRFQAGWIFLLAAEALLGAVVGV